jgi:large subunit ribosomal protein L11
MKHDNLLGKELKQKTKEIIGTCVTMGITVEGKKPQEIQKMMDEGEFDSKFQS